MEEAEEIDEATRRSAMEEASETAGVVLLDNELKEGGGVGIIMATDNLGVEGVPPCPRSSCGTGLSPPGA